MKILKKISPDTIKPPREKGAPLSCADLANFYPGICKSLPIHDTSFVYCLWLTLYTVETIFVLLQDQCLLFLVSMDTTTPMKKSSKRKLPLALSGLILLCGGAFSSGIRPSLHLFM